MSRPRKYEAQKLEAYSIFTQRKAADEDVSAVDVQVDLEEKHPEGTASYRLVANWVKEFNNRDEWQVILDSPFQWHLMDQYKLPWEAGDYLMDIVYKMGVTCSALKGKPVVIGLDPTLEAQVGAETAQRIRSSWQSRGTREYTVPLLPLSVREANWCWRVHLAAPEIGRDVGLSVDVADLSIEFAFRELVRDMLGRPFEVADLEALLVYKPWLDFKKEEVRHQTYHVAVDQGVAPPVKSSLDIMLGIEWLNIIEEIPLIASNTHISVEHPELLMSQQWEIRKERSNHEAQRK
jgi:hypothetical protein